jgi:transposase-like protein
MPRNCTICRHAQRQAIEADLRAGLSYRDVARRHNISKDAVSRHQASHVSLDTTPALSTVTKIRGLLDSGETATTWHASLLTIQETRRRFEELLRQLDVGIGR